MKASELLDSDYIKALIYGNSGAGKTCLLSTFVGPIEIHDFDGKVSSLVNHVRRTKPEVEAKAFLDQITVYQFNKFPKETRIGEWQKRLQEIDQLRLKQQPLPFATLCIDSLTTLVSAMLDDYIYRSQKGIKRALADINAMQDYQLLDKHLTQIISGLLSLDAHVVMLGHMNTEKDEATGVVTRKLLMSGKFADKLPIYFEEVYVAMVDSTGKRVLQTHPDSTYSVIRSQRNLAKHISPDYKAISEKK